MTAGRPHGRGQGALMFGGLFLATVSLVGMAHIAVRLWSVVLGLGLAWAAAAAPLFGACVGALVITLRRTLVRQPVAMSRLSLLVGLASPLFIVAMIQIMREKAVDKLDREAVLRLLALLVVTSLPFSVLGAALAGALRQARGRVGSVLSLQAFGLALGWLVSGPLLARFGAPRAALLLAILLGVAAALLALASLFRAGAYSPDERPGSGWAAAAFLLSGGALLAGEYGEPWFSVPSIRFVNVERAHFSHFGPEALISVDRPARGTAWLRIEANQVSAISDGKAQPSKHPDELAFALTSPRGRSLATSAGGGRDLRMALSYPGAEVVGLETNRTLIEQVMRGKLADYTQHLYDAPGVRIASEDMRTFLAHEPPDFRAILVTQPESKAESPVLGLVPPDRLNLTLESLSLALSRLAPDGVLLVDRPEASLEELLRLASASLSRVGVTTPRDHVFVCTHSGAAAVAVSREPLLSEAITRGRTFCRRHRFAELVAPDREPKPELAAALMAAPNVSVASVDHPFFGQPASAASIREALSPDAKLAEYPQISLLVLTVCFAVSLLALVLLLPLIARRREALAQAGRRARFATLSASAFYGFGLVAAAIPLQAHAAAWIGAADRGQRVVAAVFCFGFAIGAWLQRRSSLGRSRGRAAGLGFGLAVSLVALASLVPRLAAPILDGGGLIAVLAGTLLLLLVAAPFGALATLILLVAVSRSRSLVGWIIALAAGAGLLSAALVTLAAMALGYAFSLLLAGVALFAVALRLPEAALALPRPASGAPTSA